MDQNELVKEIVKANSQEVYSDAVQPSIRILGQTLARCVSLFATPIGRTAHILEKNLNNYFDKLEQLPAENIVEPDTRILVPILEKLRYTDDDYVANYYAEILATASTKESAKKVLTTFIEILNRLSADEIKILEFLASGEYKIDIEPFTEEEGKKYGRRVGVKSVTLTNSFPVVDINLHQKDMEGYSCIGKNCNLLPDLVKLDSPENIDAYIDNMISLGLLEKPWDKNFAIKKIYDCLEKDKDIESYKAKLPDGHRVEFARGRIDITDLGKKLLEICSKKIKNDQS